MRDGYHYVNGVKDDDGWVIIKNSQDETKTGPVDSTVTINTNKDQTADITLDNVNIDVSDRERCRLDREG